MSSGQQPKCPSCGGILDWKKDELNMNPSGVVRMGLTEKEIDQLLDDDGRKKIGYWNCKACDKWFMTFNDHSKWYVFNPKSATIGSKERRWVCLTEDNSPEKVMFT